MNLVVRELSLAHLERLTHYAFQCDCAFIIIILHTHVGRKQRSHSSPYINDSCYLR